VSPASGPRISFAIPYYANLVFLEEAIRSVLGQTVGDWELLVVDDHGPEPAAELVSAFADPRVSYALNPRNLGLPGSWNECVRLSSAPLVTLVHGDDRLTPSYAERVLEVADRHPAAAGIFTGARIIDEHGAAVRTPVDTAKDLLSRRHRSGVLEGDHGLAALVGGNFICCPTLALRREIVGETPFRADWGFVADWDLTTHQLIEGRALVGIDERLLDYRRHSSQTTSQMTADARRFREELRFLRSMQVEAARRGFPRSARSARRRVATRGHLAFSAMTDLLGGRRQAAREKAALLWSDLRR
jgi:glycosyltransferase involved in cell wall biosynthesis